MNRDEVIVIEAHSKEGCDARLSCAISSDRDDSYVITGECDAGGVLFEYMRAAAKNRYG